MSQREGSLCVDLSMSNWSAIYHNDHADTLLLVCWREGPSLHNAFDGRAACNDCHARVPTHMCQGSGQVLCSSHDDQRSITMILPVSLSSRAKEKDCIITALSVVIKLHNLPNCDGMGANLRKRRGFLCMFLRARLFKRIARSEHA